MPFQKTGLSVDVMRQYLRDAGVVYFNYGEVDEVLIGATNGGNSIEITPEIIQEMVDGHPGDVMGDKRIVASKAKVTINLSNSGSNAAILAANAAADSAAGGTYRTITRDRQITNGDYITNIAIVIEKSGTTTDFVLIFKNCLAIGSYKLDFKEKDKAITPIEFTPHYDITDLDTEPWEIRNPNEGATGYFTLTYVAGTNGKISIEDGYNNPMTVQDGGDGGLVYAIADSGYAFDAWSDASTDNPRQDTSVAADATLTASFVSL